MLFNIKHTQVKNSFCSWEIGQIIPWTERVNPKTTEEGRGGGGEGG